MALSKNISELTLQEIYELQSKLLATSIEDNTYLPHSDIPDLNKGLNTGDAQTIIGAINSILTIAEDVRDTNKDFIDRFNRIIGNEEVNPELQSKLLGIGNNFYDALIKTWEKAGGNESAKLEQFEAELEKLKKDIEDLVLESKEDYSVYEDELYTGSTFTLTYEPVSQELISIYINGIHYENDCFSFSDDNKTITWESTDFDIVTSYKLSTTYDASQNYYILNKDVYQLVGTLGSTTFSEGTYYEVDEKASDKVLVKYSYL